MNHDALLADGWTEIIPTGYTATLGPLWRRGQRDTRQIGFIAGPQHSNMVQNSVHGGALATFADIALGMRVADELSGSHMATLQLHLNYLVAPKIGTFIWCAPELVRCGTRIAQVRGLIKAGTLDGHDVTVVSGDGLWRIFGSGKTRKIDVV